MNHITINGQKETDRLERELSLRNGALVLVKNAGAIKSVFMVVSFRDNKGRYVDQDTAPYCTLVNLDSGYYAFEERCSRETTVRRVLNHILRLGTCRRVDKDNPYGLYDVEVKYLDEYKIDISI